MSENTSGNQPEHQGQQYRGPQYGGPGPQQGPQQPGPQQPGPQYGGPQYGGPQGQAPQQGGQYYGPQYGGQPPQGGQPQSGQPGQQGRPGQPPQSGQYPYAPQGGQPGQPPKKSGNAKTLIIIGAVVLALIVVGIGVGVATLNRPEAPTTQGGGSGGGGGQSQAPAANQAAAVKAYLDALSSGSAADVLATLAAQPTDKTFLTDAVLTQSRKAAPMTGVTVSEPTSEYDSSIDASYKLGSTAVNASISVTEQGDGWKVREGVAELRLSSRPKSLPMLINGVAVKTDSVKVFPGAYQFTTGAKYITYGDEDTVVVQDPTDYPRGLSDIQPTLSSDGEKAYTAAVKSSLKSCLSKADLSPSGCPNVARDGGNKVDKDTITWKLKNDPYSELKPRLDYENPSVATAYMSLQFEVKADCNGGGSCSLDTYASGKPQVKMTAEPLKVTWAS